MGKLQIGVAIAAVLVAAWQSGQHRQNASELATVVAEAQAESQKIEARQDALAACADAIEALKSQVPLWKKELYEGGEEWIGRGS